MSGLTRVCCSAVLGVVAFIGPVWAAGKPADSITRTVDLVSPVTVAGKSLPEGEYKIVVSGSQASFLLHGKVIAEVPCTRKDLTQKPDQDVTLIDNGTLTQIKFAGVKQEIDF